MSYSDKELKEATQIAYLSLLEKGQDALETEGKVGPYSIKEIIATCIDEEAARKSCIENGIPEDEISFKDIVKYSDISDEDKERISRFSDEMLEWKIRDINDFNQENGLYGCVIETADKEAIIAFRGSENMKKYQNLVNDWANADFALLNSKETKQQQEVDRYIDSLMENHILEKYNSLAVTGHSLGGNLASHFTIAAAKPGREEIFDKIGQCVNFDGPGVSDEYIEAHQNEISKASSKIKHYSWSAIGELLNGIPGEDKEFLAINNDLHKDSLLDRFKYKLITRHDTRSIMFDENGNAKRGKQDIFSMIMSGLSKLADNKIPTEITNDLYFTIGTIFKAFTYEKEDGGIGFKLPFMKVKEKAKENPFCKKCGEILQNAVGNFRNVFHLFSRDKDQKKSGFADVAYGIQNDRDVKTSSINGIINQISKDLGTKETEFAR